MRRSTLAFALGIAGVVALAGVVVWQVRIRHIVPENTVRVSPARFSDIADWPAADPMAALNAFRRSCDELARRPPQSAMGGLGYAGEVAAWAPVCRALPKERASARTAHAYFERWFQPLAFAFRGSDEGLFTGYYEPEIAASHARSGRYTVPIYARPRDLVTADLGAFQKALSGRQIEGRIEGARLVPYYTRAAIDASGLPEADVLLYAADPVAVFFLHIQGSGWAKLDDGSRLRLAYAGQNGRPYTPIGRVLAAMGEIPRATLSLQSIAAWLHSHPAQARQVMEADQSFVFFATKPAGDPALGSDGTEGVPLTPGASLAVDPRYHAMGTPLFVVCAAPGPAGGGSDRPFRQLLIAQDTGGAIKGVARGDIFFGAGETAALLAGHMKSPGLLYALVPKSVAAALAPYRDYRMAAE